MIIFFQFFSVGFDWVLDVKMDGKTFFQRFAQKRFPLGPNLMLATIVVFSKPWCPGLTVIRPWLRAWDLGLLLIWFRVPGTGAPNPPPADPPPPPVRPCLFASSTTMRFNWPTGFSSGTSKPRSHQALLFLWMKNKSCPSMPQGGGFIWNNHASQGCSIHRQNRT